jgi:hypothetical protein
MALQFFQRSKAAIALGLVVEEVNGKKNLFFVLNLATGTPA